MPLDLEDVAWQMLARSHGSLILESQVRGWTNREKEKVPLGSSGFSIQKHQLQVRYDKEGN